MTDKIIEVTVSAAVLVTRLSNEDLEKLESLVRTELLYRDGFFTSDPSIHGGKL